MAVTRCCGFEGRSLNVENPSLTVGLAGTAAYSTVQARTGVASMRCNPGSGAAGNIDQILTGWAHFGMYINAMPTVARVIAGLPATGDELRLNTDGTITVRDSSVNVGTSAVALVTGRWYWIGWRTGDVTSSVILQIDGVDQVTGSFVWSGGTEAALGPFGTEASAIDVFFDDVVCDNAGFLAPSKVDTAFPISDNTVTGVTDNNGVTTNIWQCVDNAPPAGVASASEAANPKVGMHFPASTTCNYLANLETYATLGIVAGDTVLAVQSVVRAGEDIATGSKNIQNVGALTNPTVAGVSVLLDAGAHGAEAGNWGTTYGTFTASPSVTLGTSPTIRTSRTSESRVACVDFMAMVVAWTPAAVARVPYRSPLTQLLPQ